MCKARRAVLAPATSGQWTQARAPLSIEEATPGPSLEADTLTLIEEDGAEMSNATVSPRPLVV